MRKVKLMLMISCLLGTISCWPHKHVNTPPTGRGGSWSDWHKVDSHGIKYRYRREDDLGGGNFAWTIEFNYDGFGIISFSYSIEAKKGDGTPDTIEGSTKIVAGMPDTRRVGGAASLGHVTVSNVKTGSR
ncbi:MAG TPA: hypothetical protein VKA60_12625 [Blastocatellia bacterium]|nr:hypothetical protein [Blastocatellia bacterium]